MKRTILAICTMLAFACSPVAGLASIQDAQTAYNQARDGQLDISDALEIVRAEPDLNTSPVLLAYQGSLVAMSAADYWLPFRRLKYVNEGLDLLDQAASGTDPERSDFFEVMLIVAITNASVPGFLDRAEFAQRYFAQIGAHPKFGELDADLQATVFAWQARLTGQGSADYAALRAKALAADETAALEVLEKE